jgi:hypothetical protein
LKQSASEAGVGMILAPLLLAVKPLHQMNGNVALHDAEFVVFFQRSARAVVTGIAALCFTSFARFGHRNRAGVTSAQKLR